MSEERTLARWDAPIVAVLLDDTGWLGADRITERCTDHWAKGKVRLWLAEAWELGIVRARKREGFEREFRLTPAGLRWAQARFGA